MKFALVLAAFVLCASAHLFTEEQYRAQWHQWSSEHNKLYSPQEYYQKYKTFCNNLDFITSQNELGLSYELGLNEFADLTFDEFSAKYMSVKPVEQPYRRSLNTLALEQDPPQEVDWVKAGKVGAVKDQGQCGSCWAFSAVAAIEGFIAIKTEKMVSLAEQELVDCSGSYGNQGCNGGLMDDAFEYVKDKKGLCESKDYKYTAKDGQCKKCKHYPDSAIAGFTDVPANNETELMAASAETVVSVAIEASNSFQFYKKGIYTGPCGTQLNHGVALVGYGKDGKNFWKVRNSWGSGWGEAGYIRMVRGASGPQGICGICKVASYISDQ